MPECIICNHKYSNLLFKKLGDDYFKCRNCGLVFIYPRPDQQTCIDTYENLSKKYFTSSPKIEEDLAYPFKKELDFLERFKSNGRILDIGCSTGAFLGIANKRGWQPYGVEIASPSVEFMKNKYNFEIHYGFLTDANYPSDYFDAVTCFQSLEHVIDPAIYIKEYFRVLRPGGVLIISVPNFKGITTSLLKSRYYYVQKDHLSYFSPRSLKLLLEINKFKILKIKTRGIDFINIILGSISGSTQKGGFQHKIYYAQRNFMQKKFLKIIKYILRIFLLPLYYFGRGDGLFVYAQKPNT